MGESVKNWARGLRAACLFKRRERKIMRNSIGQIGRIGLVGLACVCARAGSPTYSSQTAAGATGAEAIFAADPGLQIRGGGAIGSSDRAAWVVQFGGCGTPTGCCRVQP